MNQFNCVVASEDVCYCPECCPKEVLMPREGMSQVNLLPSYDVMTEDCQELPWLKAEYEENHADANVVVQFILAGITARGYIPASMDAALDNDRGPINKIRKWVKSLSERDVRLVKAYALGECGELMGEFDCYDQWVSSNDVINRRDDIESIIELMGEVDKESQKTLIAFAKQVDKKADGRIEDIVALLDRSDKLAEVRSSSLRVLEHDCWWHECWFAAN